MWPNPQETYSGHIFWCFHDIADNSPRKENISRNDTYCSTDTNNK